MESRGKEINEDDDRERDIWVLIGQCGNGLLSDEEDSTGRMI